MVKTQKPIAKTLKNLGVAKATLKKKTQLRTDKLDKTNGPLKKKEKIIKNVDEISKLKPTKLQSKDSKIKKPVSKQIKSAVAAPSQDVKKKQKISENAATAKPKKPLVLAPPKELTTSIESAASSDEEEKKSLKPNSKENRITHAVEPEHFDETEFDAIVNENNVQKIVKALTTLVGKQVAEKKTSIFSDYRYNLNVCCFKIPSCPKTMVKLKVKHSIASDDDDVAIVVSDLQRGSKVDYEPTIQHYEDIFRKAGVRTLHIIPFNKLRNEYRTFEAKQKLNSTYDYFLVDGRIAGHVQGFLGKTFQKARSTFHSVRFDQIENIRREIEKALLRTAYRQFGKGNMISIPVGNDKHSSKQVADNIISVASQLKRLFPGGLANIRTMFVKIDRDGTSSLPIYANTNNAPPETPYVVGIREQRMLKLKREANEVLSGFAITKDAKVVRLTKEQKIRKRNVKEAREALLADREAAASNAENESDDENERDDENESEEENQSGDEDSKIDDKNQSGDENESDEEESENEDKGQHLPAKKIRKEIVHPQVSVKNVKKQNELKVSSDVQKEKDAPIPAKQKKVVAEKNVGKKLSEKVKNQSSLEVNGDVRKEKESLVPAKKTNVVERVRKQNGLKDGVTSKEKRTTKVAKKVIEKKGVAKKVIEKKGVEKKVGKKPVRKEKSLDQKKLTKKLKSKDI